MKSQRKQFLGKLGPVSTDFKQPEEHNGRRFASVKIAAFMTHFQSTDLSSADKTLNQTVITLESGKYTQTRILCNHSQLCVCVCADDCDEALLASRSGKNRRHRHHKHPWCTHIHTDYNHSGQ